ncbi:MAG: hypothetical protein JWO33_8 [Caulobacteraceae bacterium]|nr:hypothetical protein [Caulobacteraceae bacterium]
MIICDRSGTVVYADSTAQTSASKCGLSVSSGPMGRIGGLTCEQSRRLLASIRAALDSGIGAGTCLEGQAGQRMLIVVSRLPQGRGQQAGLALVAIRSDDEPRPPSLEVIRQMFNFTPAEADLALRMMGKQSLAEIRMEKGVSENTVRTQLAHVFSKTGVASQRELVRLLAMIPPGS